MPSVLERWNVVKIKGEVIAYTILKVDKKSELARKLVDSFLMLGVCVWGGGVKLSFLDGPEAFRIRRQRNRVKSN